ncbi:hypothetical protein O6H91_18G073300 [Diphasiastrum complanatum]|nr:hypothetical protein O6H91_18G073300 [Diphasiastrum complanatum]
MERQAMNKNSKRCQEWLPRKKRFCASLALPGLEYCGNHRPSTTEIRVPCLIDPSHTVLQSELQIHAKKCPALKQLQSASQQPYFHEGMNAGSDDDGEDHRHVNYCLQEHNLLYHNLDNSENPIARKGVSRGQQAGATLPMAEGNSTLKSTSVSSKMKRSAVAVMHRAEFDDLLQRIESVHKNYCSEPEESVLQPMACCKWLESNIDKKLPFQEKHVVQQVSLLGNLENFGLTNSPTCNIRQCEVSYSEQTDVSNGCGIQKLVYVEFGAGRGYLSQMLCDCYGISNVLLVERRSYKFKADRTLRQLSGVHFARLRIDIENLNLEGVEMLQNSQFVGISKHLCGPATDLALRCCLATSANLSPNSNGRMEASPLLYGIGIATCCHHLCQWKSYVNKQFFVSLGFSPDEFHTITWLTSWALSGDEEHGDGHDISGSTCNYQEEKECNTGFSIAGERLNEVKQLLDKRERKALGMKCKQILDCGRLLWLKQNGLEVKFVQYVSENVSPENKLLLARWQHER